MRALLALLAVAVAACGTDPADAPPSDPAGASPAAAAPSTPHPPTIRIDSLLRDEPALRYTVRIGYPQIEDADLETTEAINAAIRDSVAALADDFRPAEPPPEYDSPSFVVEVEGATERTFMGNGVLSTLINVYAYTGGAHGNTFFLALSFDLDTGAPIRLPDLFVLGSAYGDTLAAWTERGVLRQLAGMGGGDPRQGLYAEGLAPIREGDVFFTLDRDSLRVHIPPYQLSAYAAGSFEVGVPYGALTPMARPGSALARLAGN